MQDHATTVAPADAPAPVVPDTPPDWTIIEEDVACPLCEYNLRGLVEPRCPECGYRFTWREMLDPSVRLHPYLYEHHPEANSRSLLRTIVNQFRPARFWKRLHPRQPSSPRRLIFYWSVIAVVYLSSLSLLVVSLAAEFMNSNITTRPILKNQLDTQPTMQDWKDNILRQYGSVEAFLDTHYPTTLTGAAWRILNMDGEVPTGLVILMIGLWPWLTFCTLMIFRISMRRRQIRSHHMMRAALYPSALILPTSAWLVLIVACLNGCKSLGVEIPVVFLLNGLIVVFGASALFWLYCLWAAIRHYLRFDRAAATVLASQLILVLVFVNMLAARLFWGQL